MDHAVYTAIEGARTNFRVDPWASLMPMAIGIVSTGRPVIVAMPFRTPEEKQAVFQTVREEFRRLQVEVYALVAEAWYSPTLVREFREGRSSGRSPSKMPDREERVLVVATDQTVVRHITLRIVRDAAEAVKELVEVSDQLVPRDEASSSFDLL